MRGLRGLAIAALGLAAGGVRLAAAMEPTLELQGSTGSGDYTSGGCCESESYTRRSFGLGVALNFGTPDAVFNDRLTLGCRRAELEGTYAGYSSYPVNEQDDGVILTNVFALGNARFRIGPALHLALLPELEAGYGITLVATPYRPVTGPAVDVVIGWSHLEEAVLLFGAERSTDELQLAIGVRWYGD